MRHGLRSAGAWLGIVLLASIGLLAVGLGTAGAQTTNVCQFTVDPVTLPHGGGFVTVAGVAPADSQVRVFANGVFQASIRSDPVDGSWTVTFHLSQTSEIGVAIDDYPVTGCGVGGNQASQGRGSLPRTGSSHTADTVLIALALIAVGAVLVVAVRRHDSVHGRS